MTRRCVSPQIIEKNQDARDIAYLCLALCTICGTLEIKSNRFLRNDLHLVGWIRAQLVIHRCAALLVDYASHDANPPYKSPHQLNAIT